jgi:integrase
MPRKVKSAKTDTRSARTNLSQRREPYWTRVARGHAVGYRKGSSGGTWIARRQMPDGGKQYKALGLADDALDADGSRVLSFDQAQDKAREWFRRAARDKAGVEDNLTVSEAVEDYLEYLRRERSASTAYDTEKRVQKHILPALGKRLVRDLTATQIRRWRDSMVPNDRDAETRRRAQDSANRVLTILKAALNRVWRDGQVTSDSAWRRVQPFKGVGEARKVFLTEAEGQRLVNVCRDQALRDLVVAGLLTGARLGELTAAQVGDVDLENGVWTIRSGKTGKRDVFLSPSAVALFEQLCAGRAKTQYIFLRSDGTQWAKAQHQYYFTEAVSKAKLDPATTFYALRHSHISHALKSSVPTQLLAENTGTSVKMIERHYGKFIKDDRRRMLAAGAMQLDTGSGNVRKLA